MLKFSLIALGGALGSIMRYALQGWVQRFSSGAFPTGTLAVNATACLAIGFLSGWFAGPQLIREEYRIGLTVGILGGYSTFSTFALESFNLSNDGEYASGWRVAELALESKETRFLKLIGLAAGL